MAKCWNCDVVEIPEPEYCCSGRDWDGSGCGCYGLPVEPPFCKGCWEEMYERSYKGEKEANRND
ncbi:hypothetical protein YERFFEJ_60 [Paenibacillus phage Yyerffej]|uniref:Uncharacterized protein n=3 Tax=Fernvirus TaxID=2843380 RepID=R9VW47_9CAUD|nr:hypothetical protein IBBPl23_56 [Paenibacillus phage phiIBB_P123]YP_009838691.1 hypothetical protein HWB70_gp60 [Paenibacillus phage Yyerffej]YP_009838894.1 hypothetical protein HWB73_gp58 [Paenibacillus phage Eltigre]ETK25570.1 hypothetical protein ERIC1_6c00070 [Paenibacillus larvae subsp. larvae DSM 25719]UFI48253.1 hypothetical protein Neutron_56 [Paenibacillus phage Neutron]AGN89373.1 hypothetical protein IBBPl23_56 [Paenibacillus phage phiIBB_P123]AXF39547.1 hypothetical protein YERF